MICCYPVLWLLQLSVGNPHASDACTSEGQAPKQERMPPARRAARQQFYREHVRAGSPTLAELLRAPSELRHLTIARAGVTVILNHWKRRTLCRQLDSLLGQTAPPAHIWICLFASPMANSVRSAALAYNDSRIAIFVGEHNFKYFGRFQLALAAPTRHVLVMDDDMIPGRKFIATLLHAAGSSYLQRAALGAIGWLLPRPQSDMRLESYRALVNNSGGLYVPDLAYDIVVEQLLEVDYLCSLWFLETEWVRLLFRETPYTFATGEDFHLSHMLRKHAGIRSYVVPVDRLDRSSWGDTDHALAYNRYSTGGRTTIELRDSIWWHGVQGGGTLHWSEPGFEWNPSTVLLVVDGSEQAKTLRPFVERLAFREVAQPAPAQLVVAVTGGVAGPCKHIAVLIGLDPKACIERRLQVLDMRLGSELTHLSDATLSSNSKASKPWAWGRFGYRTAGVDADDDALPIREARLTSEAALDLAQMVQTVRPSLVVAVDAAESPGSFAAHALARAGAASLASVPAGTAPWAAKSLASLPLQALAAWSTVPLTITVLVSSSVERVKTLARTVSSASLLAVKHASSSAEDRTELEPTRRFNSENTDLNLLLHAATPIDTVRFAQNGWSWPRSSKHVRFRITGVLGGGCTEGTRDIIEHLEAWSPPLWGTSDTPHSRPAVSERWMLLLHDNVELADGFYVFLRHVLARMDSDDVHSSKVLLGISLSGVEGLPALADQPVRPGRLTSCAMVYPSSAWRALRDYTDEITLAYNDTKGCLPAIYKSWSRLQEDFLEKHRYQVLSSGLNLCRRQGDTLTRLADGDQVAAWLAA